MELVENRDGLRLKNNDCHGVGFSLSKLIMKTQILGSQERSWKGQEGALAGAQLDFVFGSTGLLRDAAVRLGLSHGCALHNQPMTLPTFSERAS